MITLIFKFLMKTGKDVLLFNTLLHFHYGLKFPHGLIMQLRYKIFVVDAKKMSCPE